jgi:hypothetical protein
VLDKDSGKSIIESERAKNIWQKRKPKRENPVPAVKALSKRLNPQIRKSLPGFLSLNGKIFENLNRAK